MLKTLDTICKCGSCSNSSLYLDKHGVWWNWCDDCGWWYLSDWNQSEWRDKTGLCQYK